MADNKHKKKSIVKINPNFRIKNIYTKSKPKTTKLVSSYKILKKIGEGSFGVVYLVYHFKTSTHCVMKKIDFTGLSKEEIKESYNEVNLLKKLNHPNIIKFIEVKPMKKYIEIVTEYAEKGDLYNQIKIQQEKNEHFPEKVIIDWLIQTCQALKYIHSKHIIHRDIKPQNIFLTKKGFIKLGDFGVSKTLNNTLEKAKTFVGTAYYLPPELINGKKYSYMADMWSLGITFYQLMTFKMPFDGNGLPAIIKKISTGEKFEKISKKLYSEQLINLVYKMMDNRPNHRPKPNDILNMEFIKKRIEKYLEENEFDDILSKTIIKKYQDNYGFHKIVKNENETKKLEIIKESNNEDKNENEMINKNLNNKDNENKEELFSFKNKLKFNNIIINENASNSNSHINKNNIIDSKKTEEKKSKEKSKNSLGKILLNNIHNIKKEEKESFEFPKVKIKIITLKKNSDQKETSSQNNSNNIKEKVENKDKDANLEMTMKTDMTSYNPDGSIYKFKFDDEYIDKNKIVHDNGEEEIELYNKNNDFFLETKKENEMRKELEEEYDHQRYLNLLSSTIKGKSENEIETENKLINHNVSDIDEDDKENKEDIDKDNNIKKE